MNYEYLRTYALRHFIRRIKQAYRAWLLIAMLMMPVLVESQEPGDGCYYITSVCNQGQFQYEFNPGPIKISVDYSYYSGWGVLYDHIERTTFLNQEGRWMVCFNELAGKRIASITFCTMNSDYEICNACYNPGDLEIQVYKELPWEMQIAGHNYKAWEYGMYADECTWDANPNLNTITPLSNPIPNKQDNTPRFIACQDKIPLEMYDGYNNKWFKLNSAHQSNICLQLSVHEWTGPDPVQSGIHHPYNNYGAMLTYEIISNYSPGDQIDLASLFHNIDQTGKKFVLAIAVTCCSNQFTPLSNIQSGDDRKRFFAFEYYAYQQWDGYLTKTRNGNVIYWDNSFPGEIVKYNDPFSALTPFDYNPNSDFKYEIIKLSSNADEITTLYNSGYINGNDFFNGTPPDKHLFVYLNDKTNDYFLTSTNEYFVLRISTNDPCGYAERNLYFQTDDVPGLVEVPEDPVEPRSQKELTKITLMGNPSTVFRMTFSKNIVKDNAILYLYDTRGSMYLSKDINTRSITVQNSINWSSGVYYYIVKTQDDFYTGKWIKQ